MPGPPPTDSETLRLRGSWRAKRNAGRGLQLPVEAPDKPDFLDGIGSAKWDELVPQLLEMGVLAKVDRSALAALCMSWSHYQRLAEECRDAELLITDSRGGVKKNPLFGMMATAERMFHRWAGQFGLTRDSRARLGVARIASSWAADPFRKPDPFPSKPSLRLEDGPDAG